MIRRFALVSLLAPSALLAVAPTGCDGDDGAGAGGGATTSTSDGGSGGARLVNPDVCNPVDDDCVEPGTRCAVSFSGSQQLPPTCVPILGDAGPGELCELPTDEAGTDTCARGLYCGFWGQPKSDPQQRTCRVFCSDTDPCLQGESCRFLNGGFYGACVPECDPFGDDCGDDLTCSWFNDGRGEGLVTCHYGGPREEGEACDFSADEAPSCVDGTTCLTIEGVRTCRAYCDPEHPCAGDAGCSLLPGLEPAGWCAPHDLSCLGSVTWPPASVSTINIQIDVREPYANDIAVPDASVKACGRSDLDCTAPLAEATSNASGTASLSFDIGPGGFDGYIEIDAGSPILTHLAKPIAADVAGVLAGASASWLARVQETESPLDPNRGHVLMELRSCNGAFGSAATMTVASADASSTAQYYGPGGLRPDLTRTDWRGSALMLDVPPGMTTLTAQIADGGAVLGTTDIPVRAGAVTIVVMEPTP